MSIRTAAVAGVVLAAAHAGAQTGSLTLFDNNFRYQVSRITPTSTATRTNVSMGSGSMIIDGSERPTGFGPCDSATNYNFAGNTDESWACTQHWWWYRGTGDTREYSISNQISFTQNSLNSVTMSYSEPVAGVSNALLFTFDYTLTGAVAGPNTAMVRVNFSIQNTSPTPQDVDLFNYAEINAGGLTSPSDDVWSYDSFSDYSQFRIHDSPTAASPFLGYGAIGSLAGQNSRWAASNSVPSFSRSRWINTTAEDLPLLNPASAAMTATGAHYSGFLQFDRTLQPGESVSAAVYIGYNTLVPAPGTIGALVLGGLASLRRRR